MNVSDWMKDNCLKLNPDKTEVLMFGNNTSPWNDTWWPTELGSFPGPIDHARNLGIILESKLSMKKEVNAVSSAYFHTLRMLRKIFRWFLVNTRKIVTQTPITSRLE